MPHRAMLAGLATAAVAAPAIAVGALWVGNWVAARGRLHGLADAPQREVAVVLGAQVLGNDNPSRYLRARLDLAAELYRSGRVRTLLLSGDGGSGSRPDETAAMRRYLLQVGIPAQTLIIDPAGFDTYDSCLRAQRVYGLRQVIVVSQGFHLPRALMICRAIGLDAVGVGDQSMRSESERWGWHVRRELLANLKMVRDLATRREPVGGMVPGRGEQPPQRRHGHHTTRAAAPGGSGTSSGVQAP